MYIINPFSPTHHRLSDIDMKIMNNPKTGEKFLVIEASQNSLVSLVMLKEFPIYWLQPNYMTLDEVTGATIVTNPQTIYGASPSVFGIRLPKSKYLVKDSIEANIIK